MKKGLNSRVYEVVGQIPKGKVVSYGQLGRLVQPSTSGRVVGWAMAHCPPGLPWHRVVNGQGRCSTDRLSHLPKGLQRALLESEGVVFREDGTIDLDCYSWQPEWPADGTSG